MLIKRAVSARREDPEITSRMKSVSSLTPQANGNAPRRAHSLTAGLRNS